MRRLLIFLLLLLALVLLLPTAAAGQAIITTVAGNGNYGYNNDGIPATSAWLAFPNGVAIDSAGNIFIADTNNHRVRKVTAGTGTISTVAGRGVAGYNGDDIPATKALLHAPYGVAVADGDLFIVELYCRVRKVSGGTITTVAGTVGCGYNGDNIPATTAQLAEPSGVAVDAAGNLYIADSKNNRVRKVSGGIITTVAGTGPGGYNGDNIPATSARLKTPSGVAVDSAGSLYIADTDNQRIRKVSAGIITTVAGTGGYGYNGDNILATAAWLRSPAGVAADQTGNIYIADRRNQRVRKVSVDLGYITTVAGTGLSGYNGDSMPAINAQLNDPSGVAVSLVGDRLFIADLANNRIRQVAPLNRPPVAEAGPDQTVEATGPSGTNVTLDGSASSDPDNDPLNFEWRDSANNLVGNSAVTVLTVPLGSHTFTLTVNDGKGGTASDSVVITVHDTTPPVLSLPGNLVTDATGPAGVIVNFSVTATDLVDPSPAVSCLPPSGSTFAIGTSAVNCTTTDTYGNAASGTFQVLVKAAAEQVADLVVLVDGFNLQQGIESSLDTKLANAMAALNAANAGDRANVCNVLGAFISETQAQAGKKLTQIQATELIGDANRIRAVIGCR